MSSSGSPITLGLWVGSFLGQLIPLPLEETGAPGAGSNSRWDMSPVSWGLSYHIVWLPGNDHQGHLFLKPAGAASIIGRVTHQCIFSRFVSRPWEFLQDLEKIGLLWLWFQSLDLNMKRFGHAENCIYWYLSITVPYIFWSEKIMWENLIKN